MILEIKRLGLKSVIYRTRRPRSLQTTVKRELRRAQSDSYTAACNFESACMDGDAVAADRTRDAEFRAWLVKLGAHEAARIPRRKTGYTA